jgi:nitrogen-specific signal transduction histidine kinase/ActR/RegA family two-component response regulator
VLGRAVPVRDEAGRITRWMGTCTDIHEQRLARRALEHSERALREADRRKDEFLAMLAHELRNPLAPISTAAQLLMLSSDPARVHAAGEVIGRQVKHMTELVDDLLDVSRVTRGLVHLEMETVDFKTVVASAIEQVRPLIDARQHALRTRLPAAPLWVRGDRTRLTQIVTNLLNNAAKFTAPGGELDLGAEVADGEVVLHVRDNGAGIDPALLPHIFGLFTQAERSPDRTQGGLGIGLALVRSLVELQGGSIVADSAGKDCGARFTVRFPEVEAPWAADAPDGAQDTSHDSLDILVVDDNVDAAQTLRTLLETLGHRVRVFHRARDALDAMLAAPAQVAFLDIGLPDLTGHALAREIRARLGDRTGILAAVSGYGQPQDVLASQDAGLDYHLVKPLDPALLHEVLGRAAAARVGR